MKPNQAVKKLAKFLDYMLGRRPDEFGLVPDASGFVKIKELLKAITEEDGWKHVRRAHINEVLLTRIDPEIEIADSRIRATSRERLPDITLVIEPPKLLYTCVRQRAYPFIHEKGIYPTGQEPLILTAEKALALRIGRRRDRQPALLTINTANSLQQGVVYHRFGQSLYLAEFIPAGCFSGPPLPKEKTESRKPPVEEKQPSRTEAGSFILDLQNNRDTAPKTGYRKKRREPDWKKDRRQSRKQKRKMQR
jgi:putative RNA 2'-phosphotransferase